MKSVIKALVLCVALCASCGPSKQEALEYNSTLIKITDAFRETQLVFLSQLDGHSQDSLFITYRALMAKAISSQDEAEKMPEFHENSALKNSLISYFKNIAALIKTDTYEMIQLINLSEDLRSEEGALRIEELANKFDKVYSENFKALSDAQAKFCATYNLQLEERK